jgi:hypothetical protein
LCDAGAVVYVSSVFWPLIGGFIVLVLVMVFLGWLLDTSRHGGVDGDRH